MIDAITKATHLEHLQECIELARKSPPKPTNFRVGCVIVSCPATSSTTTEAGATKVLSTGFTLELEGNTHAEQCAISKLADQHSTLTGELNRVLKPEWNVVLYTSLEPCGKRLSGNLPCVQRIIATTRGGQPGCGVRKVVFGAKEPGTFIQDSQSCKLLTDAGIDWEYVSDLESEILQVAMEGHQLKKQDDSATKTEHSVGETHPSSQTGTSIDTISAEERKRQEALPRNPKKRMMETLPRPKDDDPPKG